MKKINVKLKTNPYSIYIEDGLLKKIPGLIKKMNLGTTGIVLTSSKILSLHGPSIKKAFKGDYKIITVTDGEKAKTKKCAFDVISKMLKADVWGKKLFVICLGGGTVGDLGGFIASIYKRGIPYVQIPTTLLAQIDASIGGKTAIDLKEAKNIVGTIYQPKAVFIDPAFLKTLPKKQLKEGLAETIKYGIIQDKSFFDFLAKNTNKVRKLDKKATLKIITTCAGIKARIVGEDEKEQKGIRTILNFGHTLAHALETQNKYKKLSHGEAVAIGMSYVSKLSCMLKYCPKTAAGAVKRLLEAYGLPTAIKFNSRAIAKTLMHDKKFVKGRVRMVLLNKIGKVKVIEGISLKTLEKSLKIFAS